MPFYLDKEFTLMGFAQISHEGTVLNAFKAIVQACIRNLCTYPIVSYIVDE